MSDPPSKWSPLNKGLAALAAIVTIVSGIIVIISYFSQQSVSTGSQTTTPAAPVQSSSLPIPSESSSEPSLSATSPPPQPKPPAPVAPVKVVSYLDQYWNDCNRAGSIQDTHDASIRGTVYTHALNQTPNGYDGTAFVLGEKADRFQASIGVRDSSGPGHTIRFRVIADGNEIFDGVMRSGEKARRVDKSVKGVGTLILAAYGDSGLGNATWGKARVVGKAKLTCPQ